MKIKTKKRIRYTIAMILVVVLFISTLPYSILKVFADEVKNFTEESKNENAFVQTDKLESTNIDDSKQSDEAYIVDENISKRTVNSKEFAMSDGSVVVQYFAQNVHYLEGDEYKEIDNTLIETKDDAGNTVYENKSNFYKIRINKDFKPNKKFVEVENGEYKLNFTYIEDSAKNTFAENRGLNQVKTINQYKDEKLKSPKDFFTGEGKVSYNDISDNVNLEYEVKGNGIKENIIVKDYLPNYDFDFKIIAENLILQKNEDGSICAVDKDGDVKYLIPAPYMFDANGKYSYEVEYFLSHTGEEYILTVSADKTWIETEASLPVTVDPVIETWDDKFFSYVNVYEKGSGAQSTSEVYVGEKENENKSNAYFRFDLASKGSNYALVNAAVRFHHRTQGMSVFNWKNIKYSVSVVDSEKLLSSITYANKPSRLQFLRMLGADTNLASTEATNVLDININTIKSDVVTIGFERETNNSSGGYVKIYTTGDNGIYLTLRYKLITGLDESYSTESTEIDGVTAYVNKATGLLTLNCNFASINNLGDFPLQTSLVYNACYNNIFTELGVPVMFGNHFKLNFQQYVRVESAKYVTLYDADGSITIFNYEGDGVYRTLDGKLTASVTGEQTTIFDTQLNSRKFENGRLREIYRGEMSTAGVVYSDKIQINYVSSSGTDAEKISNISFYDSNSGSALSKITFSYSGTKVSSVKTYQGTTALTTYTLTYDNSDNLVKVRNSNASVNVYNLEYDSVDKHLIAVFNEKDEGFYFTYQQYSDRIWKINNVTGQNVDNSRWFDYIEFNYDTTYRLTKVYYFKNGYNVAKSYASFDISRNPISEWAEDENGSITGFNRGYHDFQYTDTDSLYDYTRETVYFKEKLNTSLSNYVSLSKGQSASGTVSSSSGIVNNSYYKYGLTFLVECSSDMDLTVTFGGKSKRIVLKDGNKLYVTLPCGYVQTGTFVFKNNDSYSNTRISNVTYNVIDYVKETKTFGSAPANYNVYATTEVIYYSSKGEYEQRIFDGYQRLTTVNRRSIEDNVLETTTYTYTSNDSEKLNQVQNVTKKRSGTTVLSEDYAYTINGSQSTVTAVKTANGLKKKTVQSVSTNSNGYVITQTDENNVQTVQTYSILSGDIRLESVKSGNVMEKYTYDYLGNVTSTKLVDANNNAVLSTTNSYNDGVISGHVFANNTFSKSYDSLGAVSDIKHNGNTMLHYEFVENRFSSYDNYIKSVAYANGQSKAYSYNGTLTTVEYKKNNSDTDPDVYKYNYDYYNRIASSVYVRNGVDLLKYNYGDLNSTTQKTLNISGQLSYEALFTVNYNDAYNRITSTSDKFTNNDAVTAYNVTYGYNKDGRIISNSLETYSSNVTYDVFDRLNKYVAKNGGSSVVDKSYVYDSFAENGTNYTTNRIKSITDNLHGGVTQSTYDSKGFVTSVQYNGKTYEYTYDIAGRLKTETVNNVTKEYTYNAYNTIISVSTGGAIEGYSYDTFGRITSYIENNNSAKYFIYDQMGNPVLYKGASPEGTNMVWSQGRKLESGLLNGNEFLYSYDMNGLRYKKVVNGNITEYYLDGSTIIAENRKTGNTDNLIYYVYDMMGLSGMIYNGENYYYEKNTLGDIIGIRNGSGEQVATYNYDAWGNIVSKTGSMADINPFRYRGYYYDAETGFYYLQTRYYDPSVRMFINADNYELVSVLSQTVGQLNMYAYANNNPVMFTDDNGEGVWLTIALVATLTALGGVNGAVCADLSGGDWYIGLAAGLLSGLANSFFVCCLDSPIVGRIAGSAVFDFFYPLVQNGEITPADWANLVVDVAMDVALSSVYINLFDSSDRFYNRMIGTLLSSVVDSSIDIVQTHYIYNLNTEQINNILAMNETKNLYIVGYSL